MTKYTVNFLSFSPHEVDIVCSILSCPTLEQILFPAKLPIKPGKSNATLELTCAKQFDLSVVPREFSNESLINIPLYGDSGIEFFSTVYFNKENLVPHAFGLEFTSEHLQKNQITIESLKNLFTEATPVFQTHYGSAYDQQVSYRLHQSRSRKWYKDENYRSYPLRIEWMTYFGPEMLKFLGNERFRKLHTCAEKYELHKGVMVILQEEPYDDNNPEHRQKKNQAEIEMRFDELLES
ncbi:hypothetical protein HJG54_17805 [Leptolyngbya sp. NK1-12]|uniref:Uncharacterized protein n=1 Tax=Leptolyngbya sp. NK1-12 TaxID=2547451 RepID=A0AA97AGN5_9CYAN|nr:hypothetical protein [Leptolyngbya sp. NK1-12]WNZ24525.1 hypothetical protein HJG54_17805 [Leptolyngbya sp. NK1-12]